MSFLHCQVVRKILGTMMDDALDQLNDLSKALDQLYGKLMILPKTLMNLTILVLDRDNLGDDLDKLCDDLDNLSDDLKGILK